MVLDSEIVKDLVEEVAGRDVIELVESIKGKQDVSEFKIAEKLNITVNQARNMLYRLYSHNLVSFIRKKDKKKGWYIYYWTLEERKAYDLFLKLKRERLNALKDRLESELLGNYFVCTNEECSAVRMSYENAMEHDFKCPDCGRILEHGDNTKRISSLEKEIEETKRKLNIPFIETPKRTSKREAKKKPAKKAVKKISEKAAKKIAKKPPSKKVAKKKTTSKIPYNKERKKAKQRRKATIKRKIKKKK